MLDFSDVTRFALKLNSSPSQGFEKRWRGEWSSKVADEWRQGVPVLTGEYRASIHITREGVAASAEHAPYVEYGTSDTAPQPALLPAVNRLARPAAEDAGRQVLRDLT